MRADAAQLSGRIAGRLEDASAALRDDFGPAEAGLARCCWIDDLLPPDVLAAALDALPPLDGMIRRANAMERKYVTAQLDRLAPPLRGLITAFQDQRVADAVAGIIGRPRLETDPLFYNGGITAMLPGDFMSPHLDNSHDYGRQRRRDVVLLYYLTPHWQDGFGGQLEVWDAALRRPHRVVPYRRNRLVLLETTEHSWHAIRPVRGPLPRLNLTTYFYAPQEAAWPIRLTRFQPWPGHPLRRLLFNGEFRLRSTAARLLGGTRRLANPHVYRPHVYHPGAAPASAESANPADEPGR
jgi:hypothetical protein